MDVLKLWNTLLATGVCSIPTAYFVQGTADVHVLTYGNESSPLASPVSDVSESSQSDHAEPQEQRDPDEEDGEGGESYDLDCEQDETYEHEPLRKRKIHRNRYVDNLIFSIIMC